MVIGRRCWNPAFSDAVIFLPSPPKAGARKAMELAARLRGHAAFVWNAKFLIRLTIESCKLQVKLTTAPHGHPLI